MDLEQIVAPATKEGEGLFESTLPLGEKLDKARVELLDLSARNRLLNMPRGARGRRSIEVIDEKSNEVFRLLVREGKPFTFLPGREAKADLTNGDDAGAGTDVVESDEIEQLAQPDDDRTDERGVLRRHADTRLQTRLTSQGLQKRLLDLYLDSRTLEEEQGVNVLYLTLGAVKWVDPNNTSNVRFAPLILVPVQLDRGSAGERFKLRSRQDDFASNLSLETYLDRVHALRMPEFEANDAFDPSIYIDRVRTCLKSKAEAGWEVLPDSISVGFFSFAKFLMYRDLDPEVWPPGSAISDHPLIRGVLAEGFPSDTDMAHEDANIDALVPPEEMVHILNCDSSQTLAIHDVRRGKNLVIQGPPGTGKSQTIANVIAAAIKDQKTVLFVAEKMAALEVVKRRLDETGVGDACLELHSKKTNKRAVLEELGRTWELGAPKAQDPGRLFARLTETRDALNAHVQRMHEIDDCSGLSPYQVQGHLTRLRFAGEKPNDIVLVNPEQWGRQGYIKRRNVLIDLASRIGDIGKPEDHAWVGVGLQAITPMNKDRLIARVRSLSDQLSALQPKLEAEAALLEVETPRRFTDVPALVHLLRRVAGAPSLSADAMASEVWDRIDDIEALLTAGQHYEQLKTSLKGRVRDDAWGLDLTDGKKALSELPENFGSDEFERLHQVLSDLPPLVSEASALGKALGREAGSTLSDLDTLVRIGERVSKAPPASPETFAAELWDSGIDRASDLAAAVLELESVRSEIGNQLTNLAWDTDLTQARATLASRGTSVFRFLSGEWRRANRLVRSVVASPDQPLPVTLALLDTLARGKAAKLVIEAEDTFGNSAFGVDWRGERSNSGPLLALVEWMKSLKGLGAEPRLIAARSPEKGAIAEHSRRLSGLKSKSAQLLEDIWEDLSHVCPRPFDEVAGVDRIDLNRLLQLAERYTKAERLLMHVSSSAPNSAGDGLSLLRELSDGQAALKAVDGKGDLGQMAFDRDWQGEESNWTRLSEATQWMKSNDDIRSLAGRICERDALLPRAKFIEAAQAHALAAFHALADELELNVNDAVGASPEEALISVIDWRLKRWSEEHEQIFQWVNYRDLAKRSSELGCGELVARMWDGRLTSKEVVPAFEMAYFEAAHARLVHENPDLARFDGKAHGRLVRDFVLLDEQRISAARAEVVQAHHCNVPHRDGAMGPLGILRNEIQKKRGHMPLRKLVERAGPAIRALKPVFMMSPLSVAQFLPPGAMEFDLLVMDEASQIQPVDALGSIARAKQVVVVGDPKQLPPTSFFSKMTADGDEDDDATSVAYVESILGLFMARGLPKRMLRWHYRSRHQSLIAVSNHQFYENKLFIVPSPYTAQGGMGLRFHHIENGLFDAGNKRNNLIEAKAVAKAIVAHAQNHPRLSLGVAAFSAAQRRAIYDELELLRRSLDPETESFFNNHHTEPFFVKNLENVQGDERDVIFISVGYGRSVPGGRVPMRFGPLGTDGGERRLNVLISRAKQRCDVFASMTDEDIDPSYAAGKKGVSSFRLFLQYARTGRMPMAEVTGRDYDSIFEEQVAHALRTSGYEVQPQVGIAGFFIDLGIVDPDRPGRFLLGVECDGATYHSSRSARERDRLRQMVLEEHGWTIHRIWSTDWFQRPEEQLEAVVRRIEDLRGQGGSRLEELGQSEDANSNATPIERETNGEEQDGENFAPYEEAALSLPRHCTTELHDTPLKTLVEMVIQVVAIEGPVHVSQVITRVREAWGLRRNGPRIEAAVDQAIGMAVRSKQVTRAQNFLSLPDAKPVPRDRSGAEAVVLRRADMLPPTEIEAAILELLRKNFGASRDQLVQAVARGMGIRSTSSQVKSAIKSVISRLLRVGRVQEIDGLLTVGGN